MTATALVQTEKQFQAAVIDIAERLGWHGAHFHDSRREVTRRDGRRLVIGDKDAKGFPDLVLVRERLVIVELKAEKGVVKPKQQVWLDALAAAAVEVYVWRPSDWPEIERTLAR